MSAGPVVDFASTPNSLRLLGAALAGARRKPGLDAQLPKTEVRLPAFRSDPARLARFSDLLELPVPTQLPVSWLQLCTFPLQLALLGDRGFPFSPLGVVHLSSQLRNLAAIPVAEELALAVRAEGLGTHRSGATFVFVAQARCAGELVWEAKSTYLAKGVSVDADSADVMALALPANESGVRFEFPANLGRRYAAVSGDLNPIHLSRLTARLFGMSRPILHGVFSQAKALGALEPELGDRFEATVQFRKPISLPGTVTYTVDRSPGGVNFALTGLDGKARLVGLARRSRPGLPSVGD